MVAHIIVLHVKVASRGRSRRLAADRGSATRSRRCHHRARRRRRSHAMRTGQRVLRGQGVRMGQVVWCAVARRRPVLDHTRRHRIECVRRLRSSVTLSGHVWWRWHRQVVALLHRMVNGCLVVGMCRRCVVAVEHRGSS